MGAMMRAAFGFVGAALGLAACASIHSVESTTDTPLDPLVRNEISADSLEYDVVSSTVVGYTLVVTLQQAETCVTTTTPRVHRRRYVERHADSIATRATWGLALATVGAGAYGYFDAGNVAARSTETTTSEQVRQYSEGMIALGTVSAVVGIIDAVRAGDSEFDDGVIKSRSTRGLSTCRQVPTRNTVLGLAQGGREVLQVRTDEDGVATFSFLDVGEERFPTSAAQLHVSIKGVDVPLATFGALGLTSIRESLLADPRSQLATQVLERHREACGRAVATARSAVPSEPADPATNAHSLWLAAKSACSDLWTSAFEAELSDVEERIADGECRSRIGRAAAAFVEDTDTTVDEMTEELATLHSLCTKVEHVARLRALDGKLATAVRRLERNAAVEARRAARAEAAEALREARERARTQRSFPEPTTSWPERSSACCKVCSTGKACGDSCISRSKMCHKGAGCACDG